MEFGNGKWVIFGLKGRFFGRVEDVRVFRGYFSVVYGSSFVGGCYFNFKVLAFRRLYFSLEIVGRR